MHHTSKIGSWARHQSGRMPFIIPIPGVARRTRIEDVTDDKVAEIEEY